MGTNQAKRHESELGGHRVLISSTLVSRGLEVPLTHPNARITISTLESAGRLKNFDIIIVPYSEFRHSHEHSYSKDHYKDVFDKQSLEALDGGSTICFLHHKDATPGQLNRYRDSGYNSEETANLCFETQAGFRWIFQRKILILRNDTVILKADVKRGEFGTFLNRWGASYNCFMKSGKETFDDIIYSLNDDYVMGFSLRSSRGSIVYLPFQPNTDHPQDFSESLSALVDSLLTYKAKSSRELPEWAKSPFFKDEIRLSGEKLRLETELGTLNSQLIPFEEAKSLLVSSERMLESSVPKFISSKLGIKIHTDEKFFEDFWILDEAGKQIAICEIKSSTKGFKKSAIYDVYNHRESHDLEEAFPALLFVNFNLQAGSWQQKSVPISKGDCEIAVKNHVLIIRIEDLVQMWDLCLNNKLTKTEILKHLTSECGWLECKDGKLTVHK